MLTNLSPTSIQGKFTFVLRVSHEEYMFYYVIFPNNVFWTIPFHPCQSPSSGSLFMFLLPVYPCYES